MTATHVRRSFEEESMAVAENQQFEVFPELHETPEEIAFEVRAQEGALWTGGRLLIGIWAFAMLVSCLSARRDQLWNLERLIPAIKM